MDTLRLALILGAILQVGANMAFFDRSRCVTQSGVLQTMDSSLDKGKAHVFFGMRIECDGKIKEWEFFAKEKGSMYLAVWRRDHKDGTMRIVGKNWVTAEAKGYNRMEVPLQERIEVQIGDVLGVHYENSNDPTVITMQTQPTDDFYLGQVAQVSILNDDLHQGMPLAEGLTKPGIASVKATVAGVTQNLRLIDGDTSREGRAEMFKMDVWGTICDKWFVPRGWPLLLCYELGYPDVERAVPARRVMPLVSANYPIHSVNPRCKPSQNISISDCKLHHLRTCMHYDDIFIACAAKVRLAPSPPGFTGGVPQIFDSGIWGDVCDDRLPSYHLENPSKSWLTAFCSELGKGRLKHVERYAQTGIVTKSLLENPECGDTLNPDNMNQCQSGPLETECDGKLYTVECEEP